MYQNEPRAKVGRVSNLAGYEAPHGGRGRCRAANRARGKYEPRINRIRIRSRKTKVCGLCSGNTGREIHQIGYTEGCAELQAKGRLSIGRQNVLTDQLLRYVNSPAPKLIKVKVER